MNGLMTLIVMGVNFGISWWNAKQAGQSWLEAKALGGFVWVVTLCAAIQSALGFTTVICYALASIAKGAGLLSDSAYQAVAALDYLMVIIPLIGTGLIITLSSWRIAFREKSLVSMGAAAYNTLAMAYDMASAAKNIPSLINSLKFLGSSGDGDKDGEDSGIGLKVVMIVLAALVLGILLTVWIVRTNIRKASLSQILQAARPQGSPAAMQTTSTQASPAAAQQQMTQAGAPQGYAATMKPPISQIAFSQTPTLTAEKRSMGKGLWVLLIVIVACAAATFLGYRYNSMHPADNYFGSAPDNSPAGSDTTASTLSGVLGDSGNGVSGTGSPATGAPAPQAVPVQAPSPQAMQQAAQQDMAGQAQSSTSKVTMNTYGNVVASFYPGKSPLDAIDDALVSIHSGLTVMDMAPSGYPEYQVECEANGQCVGGTGTSMGTAADVAKEMLPVNPVDVGQGGITCGQYICNDGKGNVIGRTPTIAH